MKNKPYKNNNLSKPNHQVMLRNLAVPRKLQGVEEKSKPQTDMYNNVNIVV